MRFSTFEEWRADFLSALGPVSPGTDPRGPVYWYDAFNVSLKNRNEAIEVMVQMQGQHPGFTAGTTFRTWTNVQPQDVAAKVLGWVRSRQTV